MGPHEQEEELSQYGAIQRNDPRIVKIFGNITMFSAPMGLLVVSIIFEFGLGDLLAEYKFFECILSSGLLDAWPKLELDYKMLVSAGAIEFSVKYVMYYFFILFVGIGFWMALLPITTTVYLLYAIPVKRYVIKLHLLNIALVTVLLGFAIFILPTPKLWWGEGIFFYIYCIVSLFYFFISAFYLTYLKILKMVWRKIASNKQFGGGNY